MNSLPSSKINTYRKKKVKDKGKNHRKTENEKKNPKQVDAKYV